MLPSYININSGSSGDVSTDSIWDAKGDLAVGSGVNASVKLTKGTPGQVLTSNATTLSWVTPYVHPTGDGNSHVPANSTTNSGKVLTAGASAGLYTWETASAGGLTTTPIIVTSTVTNFPGATVNDILLVTTSDGNPAWLGGAAGEGFVVNSGDLLICVTTTIAGTYAVVGVNWNIQKRLISNPDGFRAVEIASNTIVPTITNGYYWLNNVMYKVENLVHTRVDGPVEIDAHTAATPSASQLSSVNMTTIHNYNQAAADVNNTLPTTAANLGFMANVATAQAGNYWRFTAASAGTIYLNGSATGKDYVQYTAPAVGNYFSAMTMKRGAVYVWGITDGLGALTTN